MRLISTNMKYLIWTQMSLITFNLRIKNFFFQSQNPIQWIGINTVRGICRFRTGVSYDLVLQVRSWNFASSDLKLKQYVYCVYNSLRLMDVNANIDIRVSLGLLPTQTDPVKFIASVQACASVTGSDKYDIAYNRVKCYNQQYPKDIIALWFDLIWIKIWW